MKYKIYLIQDDTIELFYPSNDWSTMRLPSGGVAASCCVCRNPMKRFVARHQRIIEHLILDVLYGIQCTIVQVTRVYAYARA